MLKKFINNTEQYIIDYLKMQIYKAIIGDKMETQNKFNKRAFASIGMFISGIGLPISGIMNHYLGFAPMSPERHVWMQVHNILGVLFMVLALMHVKMNWKPLTNYAKKAANILISKEAVYAFSLVAFLLTIAVLHGLYLNR